MTTGVIANPPILQFTLNDGELAVGGSILTQVGGVNAATYSDVALTVPLPNPIPLNSRGEVSDANGASKQLFLTPNTTYTFTLFDANGNQIWQATYVNGVQVSITQSTIGQLLWPQTLAEIAAGVTPTNYAYAPGVVERYGTNTVPGTTDMSTAVQSAVNSNQLVIFQANTTYLVSGVTISQPVMLQGQGFDTVLLAKTQVVGVTNYSLNIITSTASVDYITVKDLTLDGACNNANPNTGDNSNISLVKITATSKVTFEGVKLTRYCGSWNGAPGAISTFFFQAITIQNTDVCIFRKCFLTNNHYEMVSIWNGPNSTGKVLIDSCVEQNTGTPNAHTAFDISGGHVTVTNCVWDNTGSNSQLNVQVARSVRVANCAFLSMQPGSSAQCNIGQDTFPFNSNVLIENNYFLNANSAAISVGQGSSIVIRGNIIDLPVNYGIKFTAGVTDFTTFSIEYPVSEGWTAPVPSGSNSIIVENNVINGVSNAGSISSAVYFHTVNSNAGYWFKYVRITSNITTSGTAPNNTLYALHLNDMQGLVIRDNEIQYTKNGIFFETVVQNVEIDGNEFANVPPFVGNDIIFTGAPTSSNVKIRNNQFDNLPVGVNGTINVFAGTVTGLDVIDNVGIHPVIPVQGPANTAYVAWQTKGGIRTTTAAPASGDYGLNDVIKNVPTSGQPSEYLCTGAGSFGSALTCTATGTSGNNFFTCSAIAQLHLGQHFTVAGAGPAAANLICTCTYITGSTFYVDQVISTNVTGAAMTLVAATFVKSANYT